MPTDTAVRSDDHQWADANPRPASTRGRSALARQRLAAALLLAPALIILMGVFLIPMLIMAFQSVVDDDQAFTLANYREFFTDTYYWGVLWRTVKLAVITAVVTLVIGYPVAMYMARASARVRGIITFLVLVPHLVSVVIRNFGWTLILNEQGVINTWLTDLGIIEKPLRLMYNEFGVVVGFVDSFVAYMIIALATSLYNIDPSLYRAGSVLGANGFDRFRSITVPLSIPGVLAGIVLVFSLTMSAFVTPLLLGGPSVTVMPTLTYQEIMFTLNWPLGSAIAFVLLGTTLLLVTLFTRTTETKHYKAVFQQ